MDNHRSSGNGNLDDAAEQSRRLERDAAGFQAEAERERAHEQGPVPERTDYDFTLPDEIVAANRVRAEDDAETAARQRDLAHGQMQAAETLQQNAEVLRRTAEELRRTREGVERNAADVRTIAEDAAALRARTEEVQQTALDVPAGSGDSDADSNR